MVLGKKSLNLTVKQKRVMHFELCRNSLLLINKYFVEKGEIQYRESVVGTLQIVDSKLPLDAFDSALKGENSHKVEFRYLEPITAMHDGDLTFPDEIEFAYYSIYNLFKKYALNQEIDDWLIVNQALSAEPDDKWNDLLEMLWKNQMCNRIKQKFGELKSQKRGGFIPFIVAGDPDLATTKKLILELARQDASVIELGVPFSDPVADGVTIQAAAERALRSKISVKDILQTVSEIRAENCETPIILFSYFNPILQYGLEKFADEAGNVGVDGLLITDLVPEEAEEFRAILAARNLSLIMLAAPTSNDARLEKICEKASGFVYAVSRTGVTGARETTSGDAKTLVERLRKFTDLPIAVGFGVSKREQILETWQYADAAVVGSAIVSQIAHAKDSKEAVAKVRHFVEKILP